MIGRARAATLLVACALAGCHGASATGERARSGAPVEVSGCSVWTDDARCSAAEGAGVRLVVPAPPGAEVRVTGTRGKVEVVGRARVERGERIEVRVADTGPVRVSVSDGRVETEQEVWLEVSRPPAWLVEARAARARGDLTGALEIVAPAIDSGDAGARAWAIGLAARIASQRGEPSGVPERLEEASALHAKERRVSAAVDDLLAAAYTRMNRLYDYAGARRDLEAARSAADVGRYADGQARLPYYLAVLAMLTGQRREALAGFADAEVAAERLGLAAEAFDARDGRALEFEHAGRWGDAVALLREIAKQARAPDERAVCALNLGFGLLAIAERRGDGPSAEQARSVLAEGATTAGSEWPSQIERGHMLALLAEAERLVGDAPGARAHAQLASTILGERPAVARLDVLHVQGALLADAGAHDQAVRVFRSHAELARRLDKPDDLVRAALGEARALHATRKDRAAVAVLAEAEDVADAAVGLVPLGEGRGLLADVYAPASSLHVEILLALGRREEALSRAVRTRRRVLRSVAAVERVAALAPDARAGWEAAVAAYREERRKMESDASRSWTLTDHARSEAETARRAAERRLKDTLDTLLASGPRAEAADLSPLAPGDVELTYVPATRGWILFVRTPSALRTARIAAGALPTEPAALAATFVAPAAPELRAARRIRIRAAGALASVDFHALPWEGAPLVARAPVDYVLDEGGRESDASGAPASVVVVGDPTGDLPRAFAEAKDVAALWTERPGTRVTTLLRREAAANALLAPTAGADLLHYAGHATFRGREGWESVLPTASESHVSVADVLSLARAPRVVFLSACDAARTDPTFEASSSLGIAQAFIAAGSAFTIAPDREVPDVMTAGFARAVHEHLVAGATAPEAVRRAQLASASDDERRDRFAFRVFASGR